MRLVFLFKQARLACILFHKMKEGVNQRLLQKYNYLGNRQTSPQKKHSYSHVFCSSVNKNTIAPVYEVRLCPSSCISFQLKMFPSVVDKIINTPMPRSSQPTTHRRCPLAANTGFGIFVHIINTTKERQTGMVRKAQGKERPR